MAFEKTFIRYTGDFLNYIPHQPSASIGLPTDSSSSGATVVAAFGGRIFYSGMSAEISLGDRLSPQYNAYIFFSASLVNIDKLTKCHQSADPTSEHIADLIDSDGGFIVISEMGTCVAMEPIGNALIIFADNGVWEIAGGSDQGFSATSFTLRKITSVGTTSGESIVPVDVSLMYWAEGGIYAITPDQVSGQFTAINITEQTIQTFYNSINSTAKGTARGVFDSTSRHVRWMYNDSEEYDGTTHKNTYTKELILDTVLQAFYPSTIQELSTNTPFVSAYVLTPDIIPAIDVFDVVQDEDDVVQGGFDVVQNRTVLSSVSTQLKYFTIRNVSGGNQFYTFSSYSDPDFLDWVTADSVGLDAAGFLITGYELFQDTQRKKQATYLTSHFRRTEDGYVLAADGNIVLDNQSSCFIQAQWEWTTSAAAGRWGPQFQGYRLRRLYLPEDVSDPFDYSFSVITTKSKLRGKGRALSLRFDTEAGKDCQLLGWAINMTGETHV